MPYIGEFLGTMLLILLGDGVVANVLLNRSGFKPSRFVDLQGMPITGSVVLAATAPAR